ncbi:MAG: hypothetical protein KGK12_12880, partial [Armatimonadetes bacterium]|nr:hypothetical protein [Armatimonadota bacterium]
PDSQLGNVYVVDVLNAKTGDVAWESKGPFDVEPVWAQTANTLYFADLHGRNLAAGVWAPPPAGARTPIPMQGPEWATRNDGVWLPHDGMVLAAADGKNGWLVEAWNPATGKRTPETQVTIHASNAVASSDGKYLAFIAQSTRQTSLAVVDRSGKLLYTSPVRQQVFDATFTPDSRRILYLAKSGRDETLQKLDLSSWTRSTIVRRPWFYLPVVANPKGQLAVSVVTVDLHKRIQIYDVNSNKMLAQSPPQIDCQAPAWSGDGSQLAFGWQNRDTKDCGVSVIDWRTVQAQNLWPVGPEAVPIPGRPAP